MSQRRPSQRVVLARRIGYKSFSLRFIERLARGQPMGLGAYMYVAHRLTGLLLIFYLFVHLVAIGSVLTGPDGFNQMITMTASPIVRLGELGLVWVALFHTLNGLRLVVLNVAPTVSQRSLAYAVVIVSFGVSIASVPLFLGVS